MEDSYPYFLNDDIKNTVKLSLGNGHKIVINFSKSFSEIVTKDKAEDLTFHMARAHTKMLSSDWDAESCTRK